MCILCRARLPWAGQGSAVEAGWLYPEAESFLAPKYSGILLMSTLPCVLRPPHSSRGWGLFGEVELLPDAHHKCRC